MKTISESTRAQYVHLLNFWLLQDRDLTWSQLDRLFSYSPSTFYLFRIQKPMGKLGKTFHQSALTAAAVHVSFEL